MAMKTAQVATLASGELVGDPAVDVVGVGLDSATLPPNALFAALPGTRSHGAKFAAKTQASAILTDAQGHRILQESGETRPVIVVDDVRAVLGNVSAALYGNPSEQLTIIGITGTSGKTTTSYLLEAGLMAAGFRVGLIGTTGTRMQGVPVPTSLTTPEAPTLQALFARMLKEGITHVVMEVSSHALELGRVNATVFAAAGFTNLTQDHLDFHPTMEDYFEAKATLFRPDSPVHARRSVLCIDDAWGRAMAGIPKQPVTVATTELSKAALADGKAAAQEHASDVWVSNGHADAAGNQTFHYHSPNHPEGIEISLRMPGHYNVANAALAIALGEAVGCDATALAAGIAEVGVPGRMERIDEGQDFLAVVDYAHKPAAVAAVLESIREQVPGRIGVVLGAGGDRDTAKRPIMGREAALRAELVVVTDDNPRSEDPAAIRAAVRGGAQEAVNSDDASATIEEIGDRAKAIAFAVDWAQSGDAVVVAGKGHEVGQLINGVQHHFDDREQVRVALRQRLGISQHGTTAVQQPRDEEEQS